MLVYEKDQSLQSVGLLWPEAMLMVTSTERRKIKLCL
jgi:hypothetical protein